jgi:hypothetical protein
LLTPILQPFGVAKRLFMKTMGTWACVTHDKSNARDCIAKTMVPYSFSCFAAVWKSDMKLLTSGFGIYFCHQKPKVLSYGDGREHTGGRESMLPGPLKSNVERG